MTKLMTGLALTVFAANVAVAQSQTETTAATVTAPITAVAPAKKKWTASYVAENSAGMAAANKGNWDGAVESAQHIGLAYDLGNDRKVQYRQYFFYNTTNPKTTNEWALGEHMFRYTDGKVAKIADLDLATDVRFYFPQTSLLREVGQYQLRADNAVEQKFGKTTVAYGLGGRLYGYTNNDDGQVAARLTPSIGFEYASAKWLTPHASAATDHKWFNTGKGKNAEGEIKNPANNSDKFITDMGAKFSLNDNISVDLYVETTKDLRKSADYYLFDDKASTYMLDFSASL